MKVKILIMILAILIIPKGVDATSNYFSNKNGVILSADEYKYLEEKFWTGFPMVMTKQDYNNLINKEVITANIQSVYQTNILPLNTALHETANKSLKVSSACVSNYCDISVVLEWINSPKVRSYDVLGAYLKNTELLTSPITQLVYSNGNESSVEIINQDNGFGVSVKLPKNGDDIYIYQYYKVTNVGTIYQSYQHAVSNVTLANSKDYMISRNGYGGVFLFSDYIKSRYDAMGGVTLTI